MSLSPPQNRFTILRSSCSQIENRTSTVLLHSHLMQLTYQTAFCTGGRLIRAGLVPEKCQVSQVLVPFRSRAALTLQVPLYSQEDSVGNTSFFLQKLEAFVQNTGAVEIFLEYFVVNTSVLWRN